MNNYYNILGVSKQASDSEIKTAFRKMAMQHHPDRGGDLKRFQEINEAYGVLSDPAKRQQYDNPQTHMPKGAFNFNDFFHVFGMQAHNRQRNHSPRLNLWIDLEDVAQGGFKIVALQVGDRVSNIEINIPRGVNDGDTIRYPQLCPNGQDLVISYRVKPNAIWKREGANITRDCHVCIWTLILGGEITLVDLNSNSLLITVPAGTQPGSLMRVRGRGLPTNVAMENHSVTTGDLFVRLQARLPDHISDHVISAIRQEIKP